MNLSRMAVKRPIATCAILIIILVIGLVSLWQSPLDLLPDIEPPVLAVITIFPGSAPQETMNLVTEPVEDTASTISGLTGIHSISQESVSIVVLQFSWGTDVGALREDISTQLDLISFPDGVQDSMILEFDPTLMPIMQVSVSGAEDLPSLTHEAENRIAPRLETIPGVASVNMQGGVNEDLFVDLSPQIVEEKNLSFEMISNIIRASLMDIPAGIRDIDDRSMRLRFVGRTMDAETVKDLVVGFDMDDEALRRLIEKEIDIDLSEQLASLESTEEFDPADIPMRNIYLHEVLEDIEIDRENNNLIITFPEGEYEDSGTLAELLLALLPDNFYGNGNTDEDWDGNGEWDEFPEDYTDWDDFDEDEIPEWVELPEENGQPDWDELPDWGISPGDIPDLPEFNESGELTIPLPDDWDDDITEEDIGNIVVNTVPDFEKWLSQVEQNVTDELDEASRDLNEAVTELALTYIMSQAGMGNGEMSDMLGEDEDMPIIPITLGSIADVEIGAHEANTITRINRQPSISLSVQKEGDANTVTVAREVRSVMDDISDDYASDDKDLFFFFPLDQGREIEIALMDLAWALIGGAFLAITVLLVFLRNWRTTLIIGLSIPTAIIFTFSILYFTDMTINLMTLGGLALAAGMLVDNAIVVSENVYRHFQMGKAPPEAAIDGANEVTAAITASTLTTLSVFFPVVFLTGIAGELFWEFAVTVSCALFASLIIALTVIPMLASLFLRIKAEHQKSDPTRLPMYRFSLKKALKHYWLVISGGILFLALGVYVYSTLGMDLFPVPEESSFSIDINLPPGTTLSTTDSFMHEIEDILEGHEDKFRFFSSRVGDSGFFGMALETGGGNQGRIRVRLEEEYVGEMDSIIREIRDEAMKISDEAELAFNRETILDASGLEVAMELDVLGDSVEKVGEVSAKVVEKLSELEILSDVKSLMDEDRPEIHIEVNQQKALEKGITAAQSALRIREALEGVVVARILAEDRMLDLILGYRDEELSTMEDVENLGIFTEMGNYVKLKEVADITEAFGPLSIPRKDQQTIGQVQANFHDVDLDSAMSEALAAIDDMDLPEGYSVEPAGTFELMEDAFGELGLVLFIAAILVYLVMAAQFESLIYPFIIICSLPLAFTGSMLALVVTNQSLSIPAMIGVIVLAGILVNDSIIMIDFINQQRRIHGLPLKKAIVEGATARLRPILMVTITTILGLTPLAFGIGEGAELQAPMAITIIGGQITGTILLLVVIPSIYYALSKRKSGDEEDEEGDDNDSLPEGTN